MALDVYTLFVCELYVLFFLSIIMVFAWKGSQYNPVLGFQCLSLVISIVAVFLSSLRSEGHLFWPVAVGNILVMLAYSLLVLAFRSFRGASYGYLWLSGPLIWAVLCLFPQFYYSMPNRILASCVLCIIYTAWMIFELRKSRATLPVTYWPAQLLLWIHLLFHVARALLDDGIPSPLHGAIGGSTFSVYVILESIMMVIGLTFTMLAMVNERTQIKYKQASLLDPLTGVWNRRALFEKGEELARSCDKNGQPLAVMLFDLDHFKSINDRFGHTQGDRILVDFCRQVTQLMPVKSYFARLGGEEFAAILSASESDALLCAERIRYAVENALPEGVNYTVSIGVVTGTGPDHQIATLMVAADEALYQAKALGRNRVTLFVPQRESEPEIIEAILV
ncbi:GGDEF domain-containing protein [Pantoea sp. BAV 3049]|uniref:GGDEF domain-containing protein n=1 Tax=Pantoea sp. BAV 3049 TaxID=2654188 RepID=UPI00131B39F6|nr:GGDEF domain-containing protein [Pantoea sp. BAV 3049]